MFHPTVRGIHITNQTLRFFVSDVSLSPLLSRCLFTVFVFRVGLAGTKFFATVAKLLTENGVAPVEAGAPRLKLGTREVARGVEGASVAGGVSATKSSDGAN